MATLILSDGTEMQFTLCSTPNAILTQLQAAVGGYVEVVVDHRDSKDGNELVMNEEGTFNASYKVNERARELTATMLGVSVGEIVHLVGSAVLLSSEEVRQWNPSYEEA